MAMQKQYRPQEIEPALEERWQAEGTYRFDPQSTAPVYSVDTPPPTVSGKLHIGHFLSYSHPDFIIRYQRMRGKNIYYPMGFDDNGLPTERLVERTLGVRAREVERTEFIQACLQISEEAEKEYRAQFSRLGLSCDWEITYRTIDEQSRRYAQASFLDLYHKGLAYRKKAPAIWCPECRASFAQADLEDRPRVSEFVTLPFLLEDGQALLVATTRPELLSACVAVFVHPGDSRYRSLAGQNLVVPLYGQTVPLLLDPGADPEKGTGVVMCCTFGDQADVAWQRAHNLPVIEAIDEAGQMTPVAGFPGAREDEQLAGLPLEEARKKIKAILAGRGLLLARQSVEQSVRVHERCETPVEYRVVDQWFIRVLENRAKFLELGEQLRWHPEAMHARFRAWVENLNWDWSVSRQRTFGVPFPVWYCKSCGEINLAGPAELPVDPRSQAPGQACRCSSTEFLPDTDVMDTWATSSLSAQIVTGRLIGTAEHTSRFPLTLRPQAHEIIRTWLFYSIVKSWYHSQILPWSDALISGWAVAGEGMQKISKSKGGGPVAPLAMIQRYSADALRYWAASASPGKDAIINEEKFQAGLKLTTKLWNVARFAEPFLAGSPENPPAVSFTPADRWILGRCAALVERVTAAFEAYEYSIARSETEDFFWRDLADNYLEMAKLRLYDPAHPAYAGAAAALRGVLRTVLQLFAPLLPYVTEAIWAELFAGSESAPSIHRSAWPDPAVLRSIPGALAEDSAGETLIAVATAVRRYKSEHAISLGSEVNCLYLAVGEGDLARTLQEAESDLHSITRAREIRVVRDLPVGAVELVVEWDGLRVGILSA